MLIFGSMPPVAVPCVPFFFNLHVPGNVFTGTVDGKLWKIGADDSLTFITQMGQSLPECGWCIYLSGVFCSSSWPNSPALIKSACVTRQQHRL